MVFLTPGCSSRFPSVLDTEVDDAQDGSLGCCFTAWLYLAAKPSHAGDDVDGLAYPLHHPMACSHQKRGQGFLLGAVLSHHCSGKWCLPGDVKSPGLGYLVES
jgi:hypothetical protein